MRISPVQPEKVEKFLWTFGKVCGSVVLKNSQGELSERQGKKVKILEEFWYGNIQPNERDVVPNSRLAKLLKLVAKNEESLVPMLSEDAKAVFEKLKDSQDELSSTNECDSFVLGFRLGARFMLEVIEDMDVPFIDG